MGDGTPPTGARPKRTANAAKAGAGDFLNPGHIGPRGREFEVVGASWEENYDKNALIPCLHLAGNPEANEEEEILFKVTTKGNNAALDEGMGAGGEDLAPAIGYRVFIQAVPVTTKTGERKTSLQIAEVLKGETSTWTATKA